MIPYMKTPCAKCPFRKDTLKGWLGADRMKEITDANSFVCHKTVRKQDQDRRQCAGHMMLKGSENEFAATANAFKIDLELRGHDLIFETTTDCINHHKQTS